MLTTAEAGFSMPDLSEIVGSGCVSNHSARAAMVGSMLAFFPPARFIARAMNLAVVPPAQRDGKFITHFATQRAALRKAQVMTIRGSATANQTRLSGHMSNVLAVANPARLR